MCTVLLPLGVNPTAVKYIISYRTLSYHIYHIIISYHIISYQISYHIIAYHIISYHIIAYHIISSYHTIPYHTISYIISRPLFLNLFYCAPCVPAVCYVTVHRKTLYRCSICVIRKYGCTLCKNDDATDMAVVCFYM